MPTDRHGLPENFGWVPDPQHAEQRAALSQATWGANAFDALPVDLDRSAYPYRAMAQLLRGNAKYVTGTAAMPMLLALSQGNHGSCVGWGEARKCMITLCAGIYMRGIDLELPQHNGKPVSVSPSWCYGASRTVVNQLGGWEGSNGSWAAKASERLGLLFETKYDAIDLADYRTGDCDNWEARGVPRTALPIADDTLLRGYARVDACEQMVAALQNGYAANVCGSRAPGGDKRDEYGAIPLTGRWAHSQTVVAYVVYKLPGGRSLRLFMILNSHGSNRYKGPTGKQTPDMPGGAYCVSWNDLQRLLDERDTWVNFDLHGLQPASRDWPKHAKRKGAVLCD